MADLHDVFEQVNSKESFLKFISALIKDYQNNQTEWENVTIDNYLDALAAWTADMDGYYKHMKTPIPENIDWKLFAHMLMAASVYE